MDPRRHGKLPLSSQASEAKEKEELGSVNDDHEFDAYYNNYYASSNRCSSDHTDMVSALSQVMGTTNQNTHMAQSITSLPMIKEEPQQLTQSSQPLLDQGLFLIYIIQLIN